MSRARPLQLFLVSYALIVGGACADCGGPLEDGGVTEEDAGAVRDGGSTDSDGGPQPTDGGPGDAGPNGLPAFSYSTSCNVTGDPVAPAFEAVEAYPGLSFEYPLFMTRPNGGSRNFVIEQGGMIYGFDPTNAAGTKAVFLDLTGTVDTTGGERGLLGIAFHPDFATTRTFYVSYTVDDGTPGSPERYSVISRFSLEGGNEDVADPASEYELLRIPQPYGNHNGGMIAFGPDGYLYIGLGDGGSSGDPLNSGQDTTTLLGSILRIDVNNEDPPKRYSIPPTNPFAADATGPLPEIFAWGLRNPWRFSFDSQSNDLWIADVGQDVWEEVSVVPALDLSSGAFLNLGWNVREGEVCYPDGSQNCSNDFLGPEIVYSHDVGQSVTGGYVYRGFAMPQHAGKYIYGDYVSRAVWVYDPTTHTGDEVPAFTAPQSVASFAENEALEVVLIGYASDGKIWRIVDTSGGGGGPAPEPPPTLSATGCFTDLAALTPASGVLPYDVNLPLWSDGAVKRRFVVLPSGGKIGFAEAGKWQVPVGTVFIKHFGIDTTRGDASTHVRLETRFLVVEPEGVRGFTYRWREDESEADLLAGSETRSLDLVLEEGAAPVAYTWRFPSPGQCQQCHTSASGGLLGIETEQLNRENTYGEFTGNQLDVLDAYDLFLTSPAPPPEGYARFSRMDDEAAAVSERARAWLHVNCAQCHLPGGPTGRPLDLRHDTALADMNACDVAPLGADFGVPNARIIKPGLPDESLLHYRDGATTLPARMPPLGTTLVDEGARGIQRAWIEGLSGCTE